jgi:hypothetical protein
MYSFVTPPIKLKLGQQISGGLLIANHLDQSLWWGNYIEHQLNHIYYILAYMCTKLLFFFNNHKKVRNFVEPQPFSWTKPTCVGCFSSNFTMQDHILSILGDVFTYVIGLNPCEWRHNTWEEGVRMCVAPKAGCLEHF